MREVLRGALLSVLIFGVGGLLAAPVLGQGGGESGPVDCDDPENAESELCGNGEEITVTAPEPEPPCPDPWGCLPPPPPPETPETPEPPCPDPWGCYPPTGGVEGGGNPPPKPPDPCAALDAAVKDALADVKRHCADEPDAGACFRATFSAAGALDALRLCRVLN